MTQVLPASFLAAPIAHRAFHDVAQGRPENSRAAIRAAIAAGYGIEIDLQLTADNQAMVFHDYGLGRLTGADGVIRQHTAEQAARIALSGGDGEGIPSFDEVLELVSGQVPLLVELKDQDGAMGSDVGPLEAATAAALRGYDGDVAVMSFNPHSVACMAELLPDVPRGIVTSAYIPGDWPLSPEVCDHLRQIPDFDRVGACFISHEVEDLDRERVQTLRGAGVPILCWTVKSSAAEATARQRADNITFEGYVPQQHP
ncbi:glycerophosphodiester phosphodiesterase family protein [Aliisedimentitalea scapharcae]|uniref:Glycerophosphodiester phosphodiesterase family protein n=1 Tax=Aliisedimentitalea scapharcae TaxID=1524259 RepID=A0ABZ2XUY6_9RHOB